MTTTKQKTQLSDIKIDINAKSQKKSRRDKTDLGPDFVAPDGGWGWVVCVASGFSTLCVFSALQQYGILYRERMSELGFNAKQITTILNVEMAIAAFFGILCGAAFRRFTFRLVGIVGSILVFVGVILTAFCQTFVQYLISFSCIYGIGLGMNLSATTLAVNTYFNKYRRRAMGLSTTIVGIGPMILPHTITYLLHLYGTQGTVLIVAGIALNALLCCCTLQPVLWHVKKGRQGGDVVKAAKDNPNNVTKEQTTASDYQSHYQRDNERCKMHICLTQYMFNEDDLKQRGHGLKELNEQTLACDNVGFVGSKLSLLSESPNAKRDDNSKKDSTTNYFTREPKDSLWYSSKLNLSNLKNCSCMENRESILQTLDEINSKQADESTKCKMSLKQKVIEFFDLDLLRDLTFLNLIQGMAFMMFLESNFNFLTPFILASYGFTNSQISCAMSSLATVDIIIRFVAPFVLEKAKLSNRAFYVFGIIILVIGRFFLVMVDSFNSMLAVFLFLGVGKGLRTIFSSLVIPSYVPLERLAAASGLQLFLNAILTLAIGPIIGVITDLTDYTITIHFINLLMILSLSLWGLEWIVRRWLEQSRKIRTEEK